MVVQSFNLDFVIDFLKKTNNPNRDKYLEVFNSEGLSTGISKFHDFWEDFAEFLLSRDFKIYKISKDIDKPSYEINNLMESIEKITQIQDMVLCDILKRRFEFEVKSHGYDNPAPIEKNGIQYFRIPFKEWIFIVPKDEVDKINKKMSEMIMYLFSWDNIPGDHNGRLIEFLTQKFGIDWVKTAKIEKVDDGRTIRLTGENNFLSLKLNNEKTKVNLEINDSRTYEFIAKIALGELHIYMNSAFQKNLFESTKFLFHLLLTPTEKDEFTKEIKKSPELAEMKIQEDKIIYESYKSVFTKNNITLSEDELQFLKELITIQRPTFDFLGITKPSSSFSRPFYFIEVKSSKSGNPRLTSSQKKFIENVKEKFGILVFHIEIEPNGVEVKFFSP